MKKLSTGKIRAFAAGRFGWSLMSGLIAITMFRTGLPFFGLPGGVVFLTRNKVKINQMIQKDGK